MTVEYGTVKALHALAERVGLIDIVNKAAPKRNGLPVGELAFIMAANRILDPRPKYTIAEWYQRTYMPELVGIDLPPDSAYQTLTRCRDYLTDDVQIDIEMTLAARVMESFHLKPESFIYDVTSTFVEGEGGAEIIQFGYSRDHRPDCRQVNYSLCVTMDPTVPLFHQAFPGNTVYSKTIKETMVRFKDMLGLDGYLVVDRGIVTSANIVEIVDERRLDLVGGRGGRRLKWELDEAAIKEEEVLDGRYWLVTTLDDSPKDVIDTYRARDAVERGFRITKETIRIRPIWNRTEQHIKAHLFICFIAYLLYALLEIEARKEISGITGMKALDRLKKFMERATRPRYMTPTGEDIALLSRVSRVR